MHARSRDAVFGALGVASALVPSLSMWGFTVDDALIAIRYAANVAAGHGWRFDPASPPSDGVTPLPWVLVLAPLAGAEPLDVLVRAKVVGVVAWCAAAGALGVALGRRGRLPAAVGLAVLGLAFPVGAWAASGMETGLATALATFAAVSFARPTRAAVLAGVAAAFRPELAPWAIVVAFGSAGTAKRAPRSVAIALAPFAFCVVARLFAFGRAVPLSVIAKPSDAAHGAAYAAAAAIATLTPLLAAAPVAIARATPRARWLAIACIVHMMAVVAVGGDWMPYARLVVPIAPSLALVFVDAFDEARRAATAARAALALVVGAVLVVRAAPAGRGVQRDRERLVREARPVLAGARAVAALDVGWVSAAAPPSARIVDLAGLTDEAIAVLPGGHTSKRVDAAMLLERGVDTVLIYGDARVVEARLVRSELFRERYTNVASVRLGDRGARYDIFKTTTRDPGAP